jgi:hypothetical protein
VYACIMKALLMFPLSEALSSGNKLRGEFSSCPPGE